MGVSTDAILAFGFDLGIREERDSPLPWADEEDGDFEEWLGVQAGATYPEGHSGIDSPEYTAYYEKKKAAIAACPVEVEIHCSYDYPMEFLALRGSVVRAYRGHPQPVAPTDPTPEQIATMRAFCDQHGIEWEEPRWYIFSLWG